MTLRCIVCRTRRATFAAMVEHTTESGHRRPCRCGGYHFPHRPGSPLCEQHPYVRRNRALSEGASREDVLDAYLDDIFLNTHQPTQKDSPCPF